MTVHGRWEHRSNIRSNIVSVAGRLLYKLYAAQRVRECRTHLFALQACLRVCRCSLMQRSGLV
ncbi:MAG: hypothetical protein DWH78_09795 [Planctomycetota bacterium]|nr:MAG: hypothetical protein DWH78_09795 [Planctomycetota bacterium]